MVFGRLKIYNEHVLTVLMANFRPDRIVETSDGKRILIDYKLPEQSDDHINQVHKYAKTLEKAGKRSILHICGI